MLQKHNCNLIVLTQFKHICVKHLLINRSKTRKKSTGLQQALSTWHFKFISKKKKKYTGEQHKML